MTVNHGTLRITALAALLAVACASGCGGAPGTPTNPNNGGVPAQPSGLVAASSNAAVQLSWTATSGADGYRIYWNTRGGVTNKDAQIFTGSSSLKHAPLTNGTRYYYIVTAYNSAGESAPSIEVSATPRIAGSTGPYVIGGTVTGLLGSGLVLDRDGAETLSLGADGTFAFGGLVQTGGSYTVSVVTQPSAPAQSCLVHHGSGVPDGGDVTEIEVTCSLQVASFNLKFFGASSTATKQQGIADIIMNNGFDLVGLQEVEGSTALAALIAQHLTNLPWSYEIGTTGGAQKVALLYRPTVLQVLETFELDNAHSGGLINDAGADWNTVRLPLYARLAVIGSTLTFEVVVLHLKANTSTDLSDCTRRRAQVDDLTSWLALRESGKVIMLGDYNDEIAGFGICGGPLIDTLLPLEQDANLTFLTAQPGMMATNVYSNIPYKSTIDQLLVTASLVPLLYDVDASGHKASIVMHGNAALSDHQPPYFWLRLE